MTESVYFVSPVENGPIKIGKAFDVCKRINVLQTSSPYKLELLGIIAGKEGLEKELHHKFKNLRLSGEWFDRSKEILDYIKEHAHPFSQTIAASEGVLTKEEGYLWNSARSILKAEHEEILAHYLLYKNPKLTLQLARQRAAGILAGKFFD